MSDNQDKRGALIIGAGLVGGAVLREIVLGWIQRHRGLATTGLGGKAGTPPYFDTEIIRITARSETKLLRQIQKTKDLLRAEEVDLEQEGDLKLGIRCGGEILRIEGETLEILPEGLNDSTVNDETFRRRSPLFSLLARRRPKTLVIGAGLASIVAYGKRPEGLPLAWILATLKNAAEELGIETVALLGTTGLGGQGTNLVWTHQSSQEMDSKLTGKVLAAYGILGVLDRIRWDTDCAARWILLTPGSLLGYDCLDFGPITYLSVPDRLPPEVEKIVRGSAMRIPLHSPVEVNLRALSDDPIRWEERREEEVFLEGATIMCGETWSLSPLQFACISHAFQMGFGTDACIAKILLDELSGRSTGYNQIPVGAGKVVEPSAQGQNERSMALARLSELEKKNDTRSPPVYPAVGSPRAQKEIALVDLLYRMLSASQGKPTLQQISAYAPEDLADELWRYLRERPRLFAEITAVIPVISPEGKIFTGPHAMFLNKGIAKTSDLAELTDEESFRAFAALGAVDLRAAGDSVHKSKTYETGVEVLVRRANFILEKLKAFPPEKIDGCGSAVDPRIRHWSMLTEGTETIFDPIFFIVQFLGGERPYQ